ncbi:MAG: DUF6268 family outer membrane beta-barrel protein [Verrucomicrobiales bacterium]
MKFLISAFFASCLTGAAIDFEKLIPATTLRIDQNFTSDFDRGGELGSTQARLRSFTNQPLRFGDDWVLVNYLQYDFTRLDLAGASPFAALSDELEGGLHRLALPLTLIHAPAESHWMSGLWLNPTFASGTSGLDADQFFLDLGAGFSYKYSENLMLGLGLYASDFTEDFGLVIGPGFVWTPGDDWLVSYFGPRFLTRYSFSEKTQLGFEIATRGGRWAIEDGGQSRKLNLRNWQSGLYLRHNFHEELWLQLGAGYSFARQLEVSERNGDDLAGGKQDLDGSPYFYLSLDIASW